MKLTMFAILLTLWSNFTALAAPIRVLIVDGQQNIFHNWKATTPELKASLNDPNHFKVNVITTPAEKSSPTAWNDFKPDFQQYDVVLLNYHGEDWPAATLEALEEFVGTGGGLVTFHAGGSSFEKRESYNRMIGLAWRNKNFGPALALKNNGERINIARGEGRDSGHGPAKPFAIRTRQPNHPVMQGMPLDWTHASDELWSSLRGPGERLEILATALSPETKQHEPIVWTVRFGKGRVFVTALGHDTKAMRCAGFRTLLTRGCEWAATGTVTLPVLDGIQPPEAAAADAELAPRPAAVLSEPNPLLKPEAGEERVVRVNAGSRSSKTTSGKTWLRDHAYQPGGWGYVDGQEFENAGIKHPLVRTCRFGEFEYRFDAANGDYDVTLIMGEPFSQEAGQRVFSVELEGKKIISDLDLFKEFGSGKPCEKVFRVKVSDGQLNLKFSASADYALVSAIEVRAVEVPKQN